MVHIFAIAEDQGPSPLSERPPQLTEFLFHIFAIAISRSFSNGLKACATGFDGVPGCRACDHVTGGRTS